MYDLSAVKNIIFDLGNVIVDINPQLTAQAFAQLSGQAIPSDGWKWIEQFLPFDKGDMTEKEFYQLLRQQLHNPALSDITLAQAWNQLILPVDPRRIDLLLELKLHYRTYILTNSNPIHIAQIHHRFRLDYPYPMRLEALVEKVYYSYLIHHIKPEKEAYQLIINENRLKAAQTLFIDDKEENCRAAAELGMQTLHLIPSRTLLEVFA
jgi:HAD superfamily hydrolase (TIGR01509 family)